MLSGVSVCVLVGWVCLVFQVPIQWFSSPTSGLCTVSRVKVVHYACKVVCRHEQKKSYQQQKSSVAHTLYWSSFFRLCKYKNHERKISFIFFCYTHSFSFYFVTHRLLMKRWLQFARRNGTNEIMSPPHRYKCMDNNILYDKGQTFGDLWHVNRRLSFFLPPQNTLKVKV